MKSKDGAGGQEYCNTAQGMLFKIIKKEIVQNETLN